MLSTVPALGSLPLPSLPLPLPSPPVVVFLIKLVCVCFSPVERYLCVQMAPIHIVFVCHSLSGTPRAVRTHFLIQLTMKSRMSANTDAPILVRRGYNVVVAVAVVVAIVVGAVVVVVVTVVVRCCVIIMVS